ncbi:protein-glutamine gamma-glutamyltransferase 2-like isoform X2 [Narcine bancroftii]|uniref:protein-glutamine gamma-glutamyltransferase 2-like isoform X2 n=1 Tax=Narcine bancroftii TaxID=1343680 RepID=UPI003831B635
MESCKALAALNCQVDFKYEKNNKEHRTIEISNRRLIVRRGQCFDIKVTFTDGYNPQTMGLELIFKTGPVPHKSRNTIIEVPLHSDSINVKRWSAVVTSATSKELCLTISPSPRAIIGHYTILLQHCANKDVKYHLGNFVVLFNPWCPEDEVFLNSDTQRNEYVLNEDGVIYVGCSDHIFDQAWNFGQFEEDILDICLKLLDKAPKYQKNPKRIHRKRALPVYISRTVSAMVNSQDDNGVLQGQWHAPYTNGVYPGQWAGSVKILRKWNENNCKPVRYGQCWVFAAVTCTVLRCLGIPTRVVTNFDSAHDTDANLTIDKYFNIEGEDVGISCDSVWNFHVWNECWMQRNDIKAGYDGWQVVDATPQEESENVYCCGPSSVTAIKQGNVDEKYDTEFVFAEVNAHCVNWLLLSDGAKVKMDIDTEQVGHKISTKKCGVDEREDLTHLYKYPDGSIEEEEIFRNANIIQNIPQPEKTLYVSLISDQPIYKGKPVSVTVVISNKSSVEKVCNVRFWAKKRKYNGESGSQCIKKYKKELTIPPNEDTKIPFEVSYKEYGSFPDMFNQMKLMSMIIDTKSQDNALAVKNIILLNPIIEIKMLNYSAEVNKKVFLEISFKNPLPDTLTKCVLTLEGKGLIKDQITMQCEDVPANQVTKIRQEIKPHKEGKRKLLADFDCSLLQNVKGSLMIDVQKDKEKCEH